jgi:hypothetical protein
MGTGDVDRFDGVDRVDRRRCGPDQVGTGDVDRFDRSRLPFSMSHFSASSVSASRVQYLGI